MMQRIVAKLRAASDDQVTKPATEQKDEAMLAYVYALPEPQRSMILMRHRDGKTYAEIAESLGMDKEVVLNSLAKTYSEMRLTLHD